MFEMSCMVEFDRIESHRQELLQEAAAARLARLARINQNTISDRLFLRLGDWLMAAGASLKQQRQQQAAPIHLPLIQNGQGLVI